MKVKSIAVVVLLAFVAVSIIYLVVNETATVSTSETSSGEKRDLKQTTAQAIETTSKEVSRQVQVYYFHGQKRCRTCRTIEAFSTEAVTVGFVDALENGRLSWSIVNYEEPGNEHYAEDFALAFQSLILVEVRNGQQQRYKNLEKVWDLVGNKDTFIDYVQYEIREFLKGT